MKKRRGVILIAKRYLFLLLKLKISSMASNDHDITNFKFVEDNFELRINTLQK